MTNKDIIKLYHKVGLDTRIEDDVVREIVESQYKFAKEKINEIEFNKELTEEEYNNIKTNFTFKFLGKIYTNYRIVESFINRKHGRNRYTKDDQGKGLDKNDQSI